MLEGLVDPMVMVPILKTYSAQFAEWDRKHTLMFPGMVDTFHQLKETGRSLVVTSSKSVRGIERVLHEQRIDNLFDAIWGGDSVERGKPHPEMLLRAMAQAGASANETVIIGDTTYDIEMGVAAGVAIQFLLPLQILPRISFLDSIKLLKPNHASKSFAVGSGNKSRLIPV